MLYRKYHGTQNMNQLDTAPDTLFLLFPDASNLEEKALLFLEVKNKFGSFRATAEELNRVHSTSIHHNTVKKLYKFLQDTQVYQEYQWELTQQVQDFFQKEVLTSIFNQYRDELKRLESVIQYYMELTDPELPGVRFYDSALPFIREKRMLTKDMLDAALNCQKVIPPKGAEMPKLPDGPNVSSGVLTDMENWEKKQKVMGTA